MKYLKYFENAAAVGSGIDVDLPNVAYLETKNVLFMPGSEGTGKIVYDSASEKIGPDIFNGYEYVDLGLPSGTLWAKCNVGAEYEYDYGLYFQWGDIQGYPDAVTKGSLFNFANYKYSDGGSAASNMTKYTGKNGDGLTTLELSDDAARSNMGGKWKMPTYTQLNELANTQNTDKTKVTDYLGTGINGFLFTSKINSKTLFMPLAGWWSNNMPMSVGAQCDIWTCNLSGVDVTKSIYGFPNTTSAYGTLIRCNGMSIRGVVKP